MEEEEWDYEAHLEALEREYDYLRESGLLNIEQEVDIIQIGGE